MRKWRGLDSAGGRPTDREMDGFGGAGQRRVAATATPTTAFSHRVKLSAGHFNIGLSSVRQAAKQLYSCCASSAAAAAVRLVLVVGADAVFFCMFVVQLLLLLLPLPE